MLLLAIESSTTVCSVALASDTEIIGSCEIDDGYQHAKVLTKFIEEILRETGVTGKEIDAVVVSSGPGSYTGLRIGVSVAKGICFAYKAPLIAVSALNSMAMHVKQFAGHGDFLVPVIDARRMEVYREVYDYEMNLINSVEPVVVEKTTFDTFTQRGKVHIFGDGALKLAEFLDVHPNMLIYKEITPKAEYLLMPAIEKFSQKIFADIAYFEPTYVKDFIAGKPVVKGLR